MSEPRSLFPADPTKSDAAWDERQQRLAALHCTDGHDFRKRRRRSMHVGSWRTCRRCLLIEALPDMVLLRLAAYRTEPGETT